MNVPKICSGRWHLAFALGSAAFAQSVAGAWDLTINGPEGPITATATLKQDGEKVTGVDRNAAGHGGDEGHDQGQGPEHELQHRGPERQPRIKVNGEVDGASMKGIIDFGMGMADFTAKKK